MILVTGGTGYLGRPLVNRLLNEGLRVRVLSRQETSGPGETFPGDVTLPESLDSAMAGVRVVYHLAALVDHYASPESLYRVNVQGAVNTVEAAMRNGVRRFIHCSSVSAEPGGGSTNYGQSKIEAEKRLQAYQSRISLITIRPGPVYDERRRNLRRLVRFSKGTGLAPGLVPDVQVHLASIRNVTEAFALAQEHGRSGEAYAVCDRRPVQRSILSRIIAEETGARHVSLPLPALYPFLYFVALFSEGMHRAFRIRPPISRHYLKVLTRPRQYDIRKSCEELGAMPEPTERHFRESVRNCLISR